MFCLSGSHPHHFIPQHRGHLSDQRSANDVRSGHIKGFGSLVQSANQVQRQQHQHATAGRQFQLPRPLVLQRLTFIPAIHFLPSPDFFAQYIWFIWGFLFSARRVLRLRLSSNCSPSRFDKMRFVVAAVRLGERTAISLCPHVLTTRIYSIWNSRRTAS